MRTDEEIRKKVRDLNSELTQTDFYSPYYLKKLRLWKEALKWVLNDKDGEK